MTGALIEPFAGIAGDMTVGGLLDLGFPQAVLEEGLAALDLGVYELRAERVTRGGLSGTRFEVVAEEQQTHRSLSDISAILAGGGLPERVLVRSIAAFELLAEAEARAHGCGIEEVHFHEVGAVDAVIDICGAALGLEYFGVENVLCSRVLVGTGEVECRHGRLPAPAPAALHLLKDLPVRWAEGRGETATPTGAALLSAWAEPVGADLGLIVRKTGYGAGSRDVAGRPNLLRISLVEVSGGEGLAEVTELSANLDDVTPEVLAFAVERLLAEGALDAWVTPVLMKKGRPGFVLSALAAVGSEDAIEGVFFSETGTLGVRRTAHLRRTLDRRHIKVATEFGTVRVKVGSREGADVTCAPEFEDCAKLAREKGVPLREVYEAALRRATDLP